MLNISIIRLRGSTRRHNDSNRYASYSSQQRHCRYIQLQYLCWDCSGNHLWIGVLLRPVLAPEEGEHVRPHCLESLLLLVSVMALADALALTVSKNCTYQKGDTDTSYRSSLQRTVQPLLEYLQQQQVFSSVRMVRQIPSTERTPIALLQSFYCGWG